MLYEYIYKSGMKGESSGLEHKRPIYNPDER